VRLSESIAFGYFALLAVIALIRPLPAVRRAQIAALGASMCAAILLTVRFAPAIVRDWVPALFILAGYYQSGRFFVSTTPRFEAWLVSLDRRTLGDPATRFAGWPAPWLAVLDAMYMGCFLLVPGGYLVLAALGRGDLTDWYWTIVIAAEFASFVSLAFVQARPPWMIERPPIRSEETVHSIAALMVEHLTIRANTFPSGHAAGSLAVALAVIAAAPAAGAILVALALSISLACVVGRYHYVLDIWTGLALAIAIWAFAALAFR